jgi:hypothetical protein
MSSNPPPVARRDPAPPAPARRVPFASAAALLSLGANLALCVRRDDRAFVGFAHLNLLLLFWSARRFDLAPPGSAAHARAKLAVWVLTATLTAAFIRRVCEALPPPLAAAAWVTAAATVGGGFYLIFVREAN